MTIPTPELREKVAALIEPQAWHALHRSGDSLAYQNRRVASLRKADAILALLPGDGWEPMKGAPKDGTPIRMRVIYEFIAKWQDGFLNSDEQDCGSWCAIEGDIPPCWTDDVCWEDNEDGTPSASPDAWRPLPAPPAIAGGGVGG